MRRATRAIRCCGIAIAVAACKGSDAADITTPAKLVMVSGNNQSATNGPVSLDAPIIVQVLDPRDRAKAGITVNFATDFGGSFEPASVTTDGDGKAQTVWTVGPASGVQTATATTSAITGESVVFTATNNVISITGAVSIAAGVPRAFGSASLIGAIPAPIPAAAIRTYDPTATARHLARAATATRRLIVHFRPSAFGLASIEQAGVSRVTADRNAGVMRSALASHLERGLLRNPELSPAVLAARVTVAPGVSVSEARAALSATSGIESVEVDSIVPMLERYAAAGVSAPARGSDIQRADAGQPVHLSGITGRLPSEQYLRQALWHYNMVEAPRAWSTQTGNANVLVAVVDNGIRFDHPALATCASYSSCSSGNLTTDGYNFVTGGNRLSSGEPLCSGGTTLIPEAGVGADPSAPDDLSWTGTCWDRAIYGNHGLHVAGTIGAKGDDGLGTTGLNWAVKIRPVRVLDVTGSGTWFDVAQGVLYAAGLPASDGAGGTVTAPSRAAIINMSLGGFGSSTTLHNAIIAASEAGSLIVVAAGNSSTSSDFFIPAAYPEVLTVAALGPDMQLSFYTNVGSNVSLSAPGGNSRSSETSWVASTTWDFVNNQPSYAYYQGTSMAAPHVAGVAALVLAGNPSLTATALRARLQSTAVHLGAPGRDDRYGWGVVNAYRAVNNITTESHSTYVHVINSLTGDIVKTVETGAGGAFTASQLDAGSYWVVAGEDDAGDGKIGRPGRRFGWFGPAGSPTAISVSATHSGSAGITIGTPLEAKPNGSQETASRMVLDGWMMGQLNATYPVAYFVLNIPRIGTYTVSVEGVIGACGFGIELDPELTLTQSDGTVVGSSDDVSADDYCSSVTHVLSPGRYYLVVNGYPGSIGQFAIHARAGVSP